MTVRVAHLLESAQPQGAATLRIVRELAANLPRDCYELSAYLLYEDGPLRAELEREGVAVTYVGLGGRASLVGIVKLALDIRRSGAHIVHTHVWSRLICRVIRLLTPAHIVYHVHARGSERAWQGASKLAIPKSVDMVVADSHAAAELCDRHAEVLYPGVRSLGPTRDAQRPASHKIGTAGRLVAIKGIADAVEACANINSELPELRLQILGEGPELNALQRRAQELNIAARVDFLGWTSDVRTTIAGWDAFIQPSWDEAFSITTAEAMSTAVPPIVTRVGGLPELVDDGKNGLVVPPHDVPALADAIRRLLADRPANVRMGALARRKVLECFTGEQMAIRAEAIYRQLLQ